MSVRRGVLRGVEMEMRECYPWALLTVLVLDIEPINGGVVAVYFLLFTNCEVTRTFISTMIEKHSITAFPHDWRPLSGSSRSFLVQPTSQVCLWQWQIVNVAQTVLSSASVTGEQRQFIPFSPSAVNNNLKRGLGLITQSLPGWGQETAVSMYADGRPSLVVVTQAE